MQKEINLENPIFVFYANINGMSRQRAQEQLEHLNDTFKTITNITMWIVPVNNETKIECVWDPTLSKSNTRMMCDLESIINSENFDDFRTSIRDWKLKELIS